jgi:hypothetical protein
MEPQGFLITVKADVVDDHFAGLDAIHHLLKVLSLISRP